MKTPEQVWESMEVQMDRGVGQNMAHRQVEATLVLADQVKRIADILETSSEGGIFSIGIYDFVAAVKHLAGNETDYDVELPR